MTGPPRDIFPYVVDFCRSLGPTTAPIFLDVSPSANDLPVECVDNVRRRIAASGGEEVLGWKIWEWYGVMIEAEFHMVWRSPDGQLHDVTPNPKSSTVQTRSFPTRPLRELPGKASR